MCAPFINRGTRSFPVFRVGNSVEFFDLVLKGEFVSPYLCPLNAHLRVFMYNYDIVSIDGKRSFRGTRSKLGKLG